MRHTWKETWSGLRRNVTMTIAVIVTMWVSLTLFGAGLMTTQEVDLVKGRWYDKIEITVYLCNQDDKGANCTGEVTDAQHDAVKRALETNPQVKNVIEQSKADMYADFQETYKNTPGQSALTVDQMERTFRVKLVNPEEYESVVSGVSGMPGVQSVEDLHSLLDPVFRGMDIAKWTAIGMSGLLLLAAALQIGNTIRMAAFARRREIGIMRLVGASTFYIMLPFLLESLVAAVIGIGLACATLAAFEYWVIIKKAQVSLQALAWIGWPQAGVAMAALALVGVVLAIVPTLLATRRYLRV